MNSTSPIRFNTDDMSGLHDFREALGEYVQQITHCLTRLKNTPDDIPTLSNLFRAVHNIKGDASLCRLDFVVVFAEPVETLLGRVRAKEIAFTPVLSEVILLSTDRLEMAIDLLYQRLKIDSLNLPVLIQSLERLAIQPAENIDHIAADLINEVTGFRASQVGVPKRKSVRQLKGDAAADQDMRYFRTLALQLEQRSPMFKGRCERNLKLAQLTNQLAGNIVDPEQLEAAIYVHDIGMMFLPETVWLKMERLTDADRKTLRVHPSLAAEWVGRIEGWESATQMVLQHHEMYKGRGYPDGLEGEQICDGAKLLAIVDAFESVMLKHSNRGQGRSVLRAIAEINASDHQFAPDWIGHFNAVIRGEARR